MARPQKLILSAAQWPKIRRRKRADGTASFMVDSGTPINGKRIQKCFPTEESALSYAAALRVAHAKSGISAFSLTDADREDAKRALDILRNGNFAPISLTEAAQYFVRHNRPSAGEITLENLREKFLENRQKAGLRPRSLTDLDARTKMFVKQIGPTIKIHEITSKQVEEFVHRSGISSINAHNDFTALHSMFEYARFPRHYNGRKTPKHASLSGWLARNPAAEIPRPIFRQDEHVPTLISYLDACRLLIAAYESRDTVALLPYVVLGLFCGLRPSEILELEWNDIEIEPAHALINVRRSKTKAGVRNVDLSETCIEWLRLCPRLSERVTSSINFRRRWNRLLAAARIQNWPQDCLRHTFASVHFRIGQNAPATAAMLGHARAEAVLFSHYRASMPLTLAKKFDQLKPKILFPDLAEKIVPISKGTKSASHRGTKRKAKATA